MRAPSLDTTEDWNDDGHNGGAMEAQSEAESEDLGVYLHDPYRK